MVLVGKVNKDIVLLINRHGQPAVGLSGDDGLLFRASRQAAPSGQDIGFVGRIERVDVDVLNHIAAGLHPGGCERRRRPRGQLVQHQRRRGGRRDRAARCAPYKLVFLTDVPGWLRDPADPGSVTSEASAEEVAGGAGGASAAGCARSSRHASTRSTAASRSRTSSTGASPHSLLLELFTDAGQGTRTVRGVRGGVTDARRARAPRARLRDRRRTSATRSQFVRGSGARLWDERRQRVPRLPGRDLGAERRPLPPARRRGDPRPGGPADPRDQPVLHRAGAAALRAAVRQLARRQGVPHATRAPRRSRPRSSSPAARGPAARSWCSRARSTAAPTGRCRPRPQESKQAPFAPLVPGFRGRPEGPGRACRRRRRAHRGGAARADPGRDRDPRRRRRAARRPRARRATAPERR